ncbi:hypothetical protein [Embleya sp. NPDC005575]|uniref:hypothetical protein n=1 Tax=Embleya sp. NPDC005575 TaxID=3156892 RepID=UPI0033A98091
MADDGTALREAFMAEIEAAGLTAPTADAAIERARKRRWRGATVASVLAGALALGGGGAVIADSLLDEEGNSTDIVQVTAGTRPPGASPDIIGEGMVNGRPWKYRAWSDGPERTCFRNVEKGDSPPTEPGECSLVPGRTAAAKAAEKDRFRGGGSLGKVEGSKDLYAAFFTAEVSPNIDHLEVTWKGAAKPVIINPVQIDPTTRVYALVVVARSAVPAYTLKAYDAEGRVRKQFRQ